MTGSHTVRLGDDTYRVDAGESGELRVAGVDGAFRVTPAGDGSYLVTGPAGAPDPGADAGVPSPAASSADTSLQWRVMVAGEGERRQVFVDGEVFDLQVEAAGRGRRAAARSHPEQLTVPMPARVVKVLVAVGQAVRRGDVVVKLEAMKMELPLRSPRDGTVRSVACSEGDLVQPGVILLEIA